MKRNSSEYESPSFNVWHDEKLIDLLNEEILFYMCLNSFGTSVVDVPVELLEKAIGSEKKLELDDDTISCLHSDIAFAKSNRDEVVT